MTELEAVALLCKKFKGTSIVWQVKRARSEGAGPSLRGGRNLTALEREGADRIAAAWGPAIHEQVFPSPHE